MKRVMIVVCGLIGASSWAQEIGTELPPEPQPPAYDQGTQTPPPPPPMMDAAVVPGPRAGAFGLTAGFGGNGVPSAPGSGQPAVSTPTIGLRYLATEGLALNFELGSALGLGSPFQYGLGLGFGVEAILGSKDKPLRPLVGGGIGLSKPLSRNSDDFSVQVNLGFGAEYWFNPHFSLAGRALIGMPVNLADASAITLATFQPGVMANFYF